VYCLLGTACIWSFAADAQGYISHRGWLEDKSGSLTFPQVEEQAQAFESFEGVLTRGYTESTYWIRLRIAPTTEAKLILRIRPAYIDHIELFDPLMQSSGKVTPRFSGDRFTRQQNDYQSLNHGFMIQGSEHSRDVYLRLKNVSTMLVYVEALTVTQASYVDHRQELLYSAYLGLLVTFMIWAMLQWLTNRDPLIAAFIVKQAFVLAHAIVILGYVHFIFDDRLSGSDIVNVRSVLVLAYILVGVGFLLLLLHEFKPIRWLWWSLVAILFLYVPIIVLLLQGQVRLALQLNMSIAAIESVGIFLVAVSARAWKDKQAQVTPLLPRWVLVSFNGALVLAAFSAALPSLGGVNGAEWSLNAPIFGGFFNGLLMTILLSIRSRNVEKNRLQTLLDLKLAEREVNNQRQRREEQERFLSMLTHELKTPLGVARMSLGASKLIGPQRDRIERALSNINAVVDRCRITDQLEHLQVRPQRESCELMALIDDCIADCNDPERVKVWERNLAPIQSDSQLLAICVANLIENALKYSPASSRVTVRVWPNPDAEIDGFTLSVANQIGAAGAPDADKIFSKYYRSPGALSKSGSGLGLYLSRSITQLLGAKLSYRVEGDQVNFRLWIPV
jgi:signal transduction histidine kinase